jgi:predicted GIY-YIG superfamily endonuclease
VREGFAKLGPRLSGRESFNPARGPDPQPFVEKPGREFFRALPAGPGVYFLRSRAGSILYIGKAKSLRQRLCSYRVANPDRMPRRILRLVHLVESIVFEECADETAALSREAELLLKLRPKLNRAGVWRRTERFVAWRAESFWIELGGLSIACGRRFGSEGFGP